MIFPVFFYIQKCFAVLFKYFKTSIDYRPINIIIESYFTTFTKIGTINFFIENKASCLVP